MTRNFTYVIINTLKTDERELMSIEAGIENISPPSLPSLSLVKSNSVHLAKSL